MTKILSVERLAEELQKLRRQGRKIVHSHGTFDLLHTGHIRHLQKAAKQGDVLVATITGDEYVNKGPERPVFKEKLRAENVAALECVNYVAINYAVAAVELIHKLKPDVYAKGGEYRDEEGDVTGNITLEREAVETHGGKIYYTDEITFSSTKLLNEYFDIFDESVSAYLLDFKTRHTLTSVKDSLEKLSSLKVLVLGDAILDEYHYTRPMGMTGKSNALGVRYVGAEQFAGGAAAVANHVASLAGEVTLVTGIGNDDSHQTFFKQHLQDNVKPLFFPLSQGTVRKRRYVDTAMNHLFEVYYGNEKVVDPAVSQDICGWLSAYADDFDTIIVPDFGNGFISPEIVEVLCLQQKHLAVNTQVNSMNRGFHVITRYSKADFASLNEPELRMAARDQHGALEILAKKIANQLKLQQLAITRGADGILWYDNREKQFIPVPALSTKVIDRIGAGDAFLAIASLCLARDVRPEIAAFAGATAAALDVQIVCNKEPIKKVALTKYMSTLLK